MKNLIAKLKGANYKQLAIDHGEKALFGLIGLFVLICLSGTSWSRYDKSPEEFITKVENGRKNIQASAWTPERAKEYSTARNISDDVQKLLSPIDVTHYEYSTHWYWPMYPQMDRVKSPRWLQLVNPIAHAGKFIMAENPTDPNAGLMTGVVEGTGTAAKSGDDSDSENAPRRNAADDNAPRTPVGGAGGVVPGAPGGLAPPGVGPKGGGRIGGPPMVGGPGALAGDGASGIEGGYGGMFGGGLASNVTVRGVRFVAIRALFPLKDQVDELVKAMNEKTEIAANKVQFLDFEIERQVAQPGPNPWSGEWEKVDIQSALEILDRVDFDTELVDVAYTDPVFTMPLPRRVAGQWTRYASHPMIKQLDEVNAKVQEELMRKAVEEAEKLQKEDKTRPRGFAEKQFNARGIRNEMRGSGMIGTFGKSLGDSFEGGNMPMMPGADIGMFRGAVNSMTNEFQRTDTRLMKYLLFRYFDFSVTPGNAYRYRIRLTLANPNYKRAVEELVDESVAAGETRQTPWSEPTTPVFLPDEQKVFLTKIQKGRGDGTLPSATLDVYQWFAETGTFLAAKLDTLQVGQHVAGPTKTEVLRLRPDADSLKEETVSVFTGNILADIAPAPIVELDPTEHADLKVDPKKLKQIGTVDRALMVDRFGQLTALDPKAAADVESQSKKALESERKPYENLRGREEATESAGGDLDRLRRAGAGGLAGDAPGGAGALSGPPGMGGMGGMMPPGMGGSNPLKKTKGASPKTGTKKGKPTARPSET